MCATSKKKDNIWNYSFWICRQFTSQAIKADKFSLEITIQHHRITTNGIRWKKCMFVIGDETKTKQLIYFLGYFICNYFLFFILFEINQMLGTSIQMITHLHELAAWEDSFSTQTQFKTINFGCIFVAIKLRALYIKMRNKI